MSGPKLLLIEYASIESLEFIMYTLLYTYNGSCRGLSGPPPYSPVPVTENDLHIYHNPSDTAQALTQG